ncbi:hypothetical protein LJC14_07885 [Treponema sp. OttesenSCG-928-L16]|nr:hypothetical protein [Treponema sp. OttesenSCG-928-L16]
MEEGITDFYYTLIPVVNGRGKRDYKMGTATWPEENFMIIAYLDDEDAVKAQKIIQEVKAVFPGEGIRIFFLKGDDTIADDTAVDDTSANTDNTES